MFNYLNTTELALDDFNRLAGCYERSGVTQVKICRDDETSCLTRTEHGWTARKGNVFRILKRTKRDSRRVGEYKLLNFLRPVELTRGEFIRLVECFERFGVFRAEICRDGQTSCIVKTENGWIAENGTARNTLRLTTRGWRFSKRTLENQPVGYFARAAA